MDDTTPTNLIAFPGARTKPWAQPPVLRTESAADFEELLAIFERDVGPSGAIEEMYVRDLAVLVWEIARLRRSRTVLIDVEYPAVIRSLAREAAFAAALDGAPHTADPRAYARELALKWRAEDGRHEVIATLRDLDIDPDDLEAEIIRNLTSRLESLDGMLTALEARRDRVLASIAGYRASFGRQARATAEQLSEAGAVTLAPPAPDEQ